MGYYDDDYKETYEYDECIEPVRLVVDECSEKEITFALMASGLIAEKQPRLVCSMEKLVYVYGDPNEVYSPAEICFTERVEKVFVYSDFFKNLSKGNMACRVIAAKLSGRGHDALKECIFFEKIIDKALDGFNIFFFVTDESVFFGCRVFDKSGKSDCTLSSPIQTENQLEQMQDEMSFLAEIDDFMDYYSQCRHMIMLGQSSSDDYEDIIMRRRGVQFSYLEEIDKLGRDIGIDVSKEKVRYWSMFEDEPEPSFASILEEVEDSLSFVKSNRVNTYEMLFEADEMMRQAEEAENDRLAQLTALEKTVDDVPVNEEAKALLENPEEIIKLLKKRRGI